MRIRFRLGCVAFASAIVVLAGTSLAEDRWFVAGMLESVDDEERRIQVNGNLLHVGSHAMIKLSDDEIGSWLDIVEREDEYVSALVRRGYRGADEVLTILLEDEIEDE